MRSPKCDRATICTYHCHYIVEQRIEPNTWRVARSAQWLMVPGTASQARAWNLVQLKPDRKQLTEALRDCRWALAYTLSR